MYNYHCAVPENTPPQKGLEFPGGRGVLQGKKFKEMYEAYLEFPEEWGGVRKKSLPWGRYGYFLELHIIIHSKYFPVSDWLKPHA